MIRRAFPFAFLLACAVAFADTTPPPPAPSPPARSLRGVVRFAGRPPARVSIQRDYGPCLGEVRDPKLLVAGDGAVADAVVRLAGTRAPAVPSLLLEIHGCAYRPHVAVATPGTRLRVAGDDTLHSLHAWFVEGPPSRAPPGDTLFNRAVVQGSPVYERTLDRPGVLYIRCDVHRFESVVVVVTDERAAVTGADGRFAFDDLAPGRYTVAAWHEGWATDGFDTAAPIAASTEVTIGNIAPPPTILTLGER